MPILKKSSQIKISAQHQEIISKAVKNIMQPFEKKPKDPYLENVFWENLSGYLNIDTNLLTNTGGDFLENIEKKFPNTKGITIEQIFNPEESNEDEDPSSWLGTYEGISSPGRITLNINTLRVFFFTILQKLIIKNKHKIDHDDFQSLAELTVYKTYFHEIFHHFSDVYGWNRQGKGTNYAPKNRRDQKHWKFEIEEALAVAASRHITGMFCSATPLLTDFFDHSYLYVSKGYKDWINYQSYSTFRRGLVEYFDVEPRLKDPNPKYDYLQDMFEHQFISLINNPYVKIDLNY
jgi:hypothetical protein